MKQYIKLLTFSAVFVASFALFTSTSHALSGSEFKPGRIIDDAVFSNKSSMSVAQIQQFLESKVAGGSCDVSGSRASTRWYAAANRYYTHAEWGALNGNPAPFVCLTTYRENPTTKQTNLGNPNVAIAGAQTAAEIIYNAGQQYNINPQTLLVLLQKEQSLITDDWPWSSQYSSATGAYCPDTAPCDAAQAGFGTQVREAARLFRYYMDTPWLYFVGNNYVLYNPNTACGGTNVYIENAATEALYHYTPYQPNAAALANLYGTGDGCSAYGNRNFWRMFNDWFGTTIGALVRSTSDSTVYLIDDGKKYPISDINLLGDVWSMGPLRFVSDAEINQYVSGPNLTRMVGRQDGSLFFLNAGMKLPFTSCGQVAHYGFSCAQITYLSDGLLNLLANAPAVTQVYKTTSGKTFYIENGQKRETPNLQTLVANGINQGANVLLEQGLNYLPNGIPITVDGSLIRNRQTDEVSFVNQNSLSLVSAYNKNQPVFSGVAVGDLDNSSILNATRVPLKGLVKNSGSTQHYALTTQGKAAIADIAAWSSSYTIFSDAALASIPNDTSDSIGGLLVKSADNGTVYYVNTQKKKPIPSWNDLLGLNVQPLRIATLLDVTADQLATGTTYYTPGSLVKDPSSATVYIIKNNTELFPISSFGVPRDFGLSLSIRTLNTSDISNYTQLPVVTNKISCGPTTYVASGGKLYAVSNSELTRYGWLVGQFVDGGGLCTVVPINGSLGIFLAGADGTIYLAENGTKRPIVGYAKYLSLGGNSSNTTLVSDMTLSSITTGSNLY